MKAAIYARVSTRDQTADQQEAPCRKYCEARGWEVAAVIKETASTRDTRPEKETLLAALRRGEYGALVIFRLDRWARNLVELVQEVKDLGERGITVASISETIDTSTAMGRAMLHLTGVFAELERDLHAEATRDRLQALKAMGKKLGRPAKTTPELEARVVALRADGISLGAIARAVGLGPTTVRRIMKAKVPGLAEAGLTPAEISRATGLEEPTVRKVLTEAAEEAARAAPSTPPPTPGPIHAQPKIAPEAPFLAHGGKG